MPRMHLYYFNTHRMEHDKMLRKLGLQKFKPSAVGNNGNKKKKFTARAVKARQSPAYKQDTKPATRGVKRNFRPSQAKMREAKSFEAGLVKKVPTWLLGAHYLKVAFGGLFTYRAGLFKNERTPKEYVDLFVGPNKKYLPGEGVLFWGLESQHAARWAGNETAATRRRRNAPMLRRLAAQGRKVLEAERLEKQKALDAKIRFLEKQKKKAAEQLHKATLAAIAREEAELASRKTHRRAQVHWSQVWGMLVGAGAIYDFGVPRDHTTRAVPKNAYPVGNGAGRPITSPYRRRGSCAGRTKIIRRCASVSSTTRWSFKKARGRVAFKAAQSTCIAGDAFGYNSVPKNVQERTSYEAFKVKMEKEVDLEFTFKNIKQREIRRVDWQVQYTFKGGEIVSTGHPLLVNFTKQDFEDYSVARMIQDTPFAGLTSKEYFRVLQEEVLSIWPEHYLEEFFVHRPRGTVLSSEFSDIEKNPGPAFQAGFCYLVLIRPECRTQAKQTVGAYPTFQKVHAYLSINKSMLENSLVFSVEKTSSHFYNNGVIEQVFHITEDWSGMTFEDFNWCQAGVLGQEEGYCYLDLFHLEYQAKIRGLLGPYPTRGAVEMYAHLNRPQYNYQENAVAIPVIDHETGLFASMNGARLYHVEVLPTPGQIGKNLFVFDIPANSRLGATEPAGFCYAHLIKVGYKHLIKDVLGPWPTYNELNIYLSNHVDHVDGNQKYFYQSSIDENGNVDPMRLHIVCAEEGLTFWTQTTQPPDYIRIGGTHTNDINVFIKSLVNDHGLNLYNSPIIDGYCYLHIIEPRLRCFAAQILGANPFIESLALLCGTNDLWTAGLEERSLKIRKSSRFKTLHVEVVPKNEAKCIKSSLQGFFVSRKSMPRVEININYKDLGDRLFMRKLFIEQPYTIGSDFSDPIRYFQTSSISQQDANNRIASLYEQIDSQRNILENYQSLYDENQAMKSHIEEVDANYKEAFNRNHRLGEALEESEKKANYYRQRSDHFQSELDKLIAHNENRCPNEKSPFDPNRCSPQEDIHDVRDKASSCHDVDALVAKLQDSIKKLEKNKTVANAANDQRIAVKCGHPSFWGIFRGVWPWTPSISYFGDVEIQGKDYMRDAMGNKIDDPNGSLVDQNGTFLNPDSKVDLHVPTYRLTLRGIKRFYEWADDKQKLAILITLGVSQAELYLQFTRYINSSMGDVITSFDKKIAAGVSFAPPPSTMRGVNITSDDYVNTFHYNVGTVYTDLAFELEMEANTTELPMDQWDIIYNRVIEKMSSKRGGNTSGLHQGVGFSSDNAGDGPNTQCSCDTYTKLQYCHCIQIVDKHLSYDNLPQGSPQILEKDQGLGPYILLPNKWKGAERTIFRNENNKGLHYCDFSTMPENVPEMEHVETWFDHQLDDTRKVFTDKRKMILSTANPVFDCPPEYYGLCFGNQHDRKGWHVINYPYLYQERQYAFLRLFVLYIGGFTYRIVNGRSPIEEMPTFFKGRMSYNNNPWDLNPYLGNMVTDITMTNKKEFVRWLTIASSTYGADEWFVKDQPTTVWQKYRALSDRNLLANFPLSGGWEDVEILDRHQILQYHGKLTRLHYLHFLQGHHLIETEIPSKRAFKEILYKTFYNIKKIYTKERSKPQTSDNSLSLSRNDGWTLKQRHFIGETNIFDVIQAIDMKKDFQHTHNSKVHLLCCGITNSEKYFCFGLTKGHALCIDLTHVAAGLKPVPVFLSIDHHESGHINASSVYMDPCIIMQENKRLKDTFKENDPYTGYINRTDVKAQGMGWVQDKQGLYYINTPAPDLDRNNFILIIAFGTRGDQMTPLYYARKLAQNKVKVAYFLAKHDNSKELREIAEGNLWLQIPSHYSALACGKMGWKFIFSPFTKIGNNAEVYNMAPSEKWITGMKFGKTLIGRYVSFMANRTETDWRMGLLKDCNAARSNDGFSIQRIPTASNRKDRKPSGLVLGSDQLMPIPEKYARIGKIALPYSPEIFDDYDVVYCHGGAGTMQTIAGYTTAVSISNELDREYRRPLCKLDLKQTDDSILINHLMSKAGHRISYKYLLYKIPLHRIKNLDSKHMLDCIFFLLKGTIFMWIFYTQWSYYGMAIAIIGPQLGRLRKTFMSMGVLVISALWTFPVLLMPGYVTGFLSVLNLFQLLENRLSSDLYGWLNSNWEMRFHPVQTYRLPLHVSLYDKRTGLSYEGRFITETKAMAPFEFVEVVKVSSDHVFSIPVPVDDHIICRLIGIKGRYNPNFNCLTFALQATGNMGLTTLIPLLIAFFTGQFFLVCWMLCEGVMPTLWHSMAPRMAALPQLIDLEVPSIPSIPIHQETGIVQNIIEDPPLPLITMKNEEDEDIPLEIIEVKNQENILEHMANALFQSVMLYASALDQGVPKEQAEQTALIAYGATIGELLLDQPETKVQQKIMTYMEAPRTSINKAYDGLISLLSGFRHIPVINEIILFLKQLLSEGKRLLRQILEVLFDIGQICFSWLPHYIKQVAQYIGQIIDNLLNNKLARKAKSVWSLGGVWKDPSVSPYVRAAQEIATAKIIETQNFTHDYNAMLGRLKKAAPGTEAVQDTMMGGYQTRPQNVPRHPIMSQQEADILDWQSAEIKPYLTERVQEYLRKGADLGADGCYLTYRDAEKYIAQSASRYTMPLNHITMDPTSKARAELVAQALYDKYPELYANHKLYSPELALDYLKDKFGAWAPWAKNSQKRAAVLAAGGREAIINECYESLRNGEWHPGFHTLFAKSQVVPIHKILFEGKAVRTVIATDYKGVRVNVFGMCEAKRKTYTTTGVGSGMPLTQVMASIFKEVMVLPNLYEVDATAMDSRWSKFGTEVFANLGRLGFKNHVNAEAIGSQFAAMMYQVQNGYMFSLTEPPEGINKHGLPDAHANVYPKIQGGSTGWALTSPSNTTVMRGQIIAAWCHYHEWKKTPANFFEECVFKNTSDDSLFSTQEPLEMERFKACASLYGLDLTIDGPLSFDRLQYLGKQVRIPTKDDIETLQDWIDHCPNSRKSGYFGTKPPMPDLIVYQNLGAILTRRTALRSYQAHGKTYHEVMLARGAGHAELSAFCPVFYNLCISEYEQDAKFYLSSLDQNYAQYVNLIRDPKDGNLSIQVLYPPHAKEELKRRLDFIKLNKPATYRRVVEIHMKPDSGALTAFERFERKWWTKDPLWAIDQAIKEVLQVARDITSSIPREIYKLSSGIDMLYYEPTFQAPNERIMDFITKMEIERRKSLGWKDDELMPSLTELDVIVRESPYGSCVDVPSYHLKIQNQEEFRRMMDTNTHILMNLVAFMTLIYSLLYYIEQWIMGLPWIGWIYCLIFFALIMLPRWYAVLNNIYWHATGRSSRTISDLVPRDPYMWSKRISVFIGCLIPMWLGDVIRLDLILQFLPPLVENLSKIFRVWRSVKGDLSPNGPILSNEWINYSRLYLEKVIALKNVIISAPTGTGKSTFFVAALVTEIKNMPITRRVWLVLPRKLLRDEWSIPFETITTQKLKRGVAINVSTNVFICTYGHFLTRKEEVRNEDILLFDEFHELSGEMLFAMNLYKTNPIFYMSATPLTIPSLQNAPILRPDVKGLGYTRNVVTMDADPVASYMTIRQAIEAGEYKDLGIPEDAAERALIVLPTIREVQETIEGLKYAGVKEVSELSSKQRTVAKTGVIVATQVVDAGFDLKPPAKILIDSGKELIIDEGVLRTGWSRPSTMKQREGRVGRLCNGLIVRPRTLPNDPSKNQKELGPGTGKDAQNYPAPYMFSDPFISNHFKVPTLESIPGNQMSKIPYVRINIPERYHENRQDANRIRAGLTFVVLANLAGVQRRQMEHFYVKHVKQRIPLPEDYSFIETHMRMKSLDDSVLPSYDLIESIMLENPIEYRIRGVNVNCNFIYPVRGQWQDNALNEKPVSVRHSTTEAEAYDTLVTTLRERIRKLEIEVGNKGYRTAKKLISKENIPLTSVMKRNMRANVRLENAKFTDTFIES